MKIEVFLVLVVTLILWHLLLPFVNSLNLPLDRTYGIISRLVIDQRNPLTNYVIYLILFLSPSFVILCFLFLQGRFTKLLNFNKWRLLLHKIVNSQFIPVISFLAIACWIMNIKHQPMTGSDGSFAQDGFHFGEAVGLSATFLEDPKLFYDKAYLIIHGFGLNVIPGVIGLVLGGDDKDIAIAGLVVDAHYTISTIFAFLIMLEIAAYISYRSKWKLFLIFTLVYFALHRVVIASLDRDVIFLIQIFLAIRWMRLELSEEPGFKSRYRQIIYPAILGFSIPLSFLYVYDRAIYFMFLLVYLFAYFAVVKGVRFSLKTGLFAFASILLSCFIFSWTFGFSYLPTTIEQILYWSKYSGLFTGWAYPKINIRFTELQNWLAIFLQSCCLTILCLRFYSERSTKGTSFKTFLNKNGVEIFLLMCAVVTMRVALGRSQDWYLTSRGFFSIFSFVTIISQPLIHRKASLPSFSSGFITVLIFCSFFNMESVAAAVDVFGMVNYPSSVKAILSKTNTELLNPSYLEAAEQIENDIAGQSCFYTLTSEGVWYRMLSMRPCSRYWNLLYSTSTESQKELIEEIQAERPKIILYSNQFWSNAIDGVPKETSHLLVHQYVWQYYRPYKMLNDNWFWIRRESDGKLSNLFELNANEVIGSFEKLQSLDSNQKLDVLASGWSVLPEKSISEQNTVFLTYSTVNSPNDFNFLGVGLVSVDQYDVATMLNSVRAVHSGWNISFNKLNLPPDEVVLRAWAYNPEDYKLYEIPSSSLKVVEGELPTAKRRTS